MKKRRIILLIVLVIIFVVSSCKAEEPLMEEDFVPSDALATGAPAESEVAEVSYQENAGYNDSSTKVDLDYSEKIIYNVNMGIVVDDPIFVSKQIKSQVEMVGGYVSSLNSKSSDNGSYVNMQVRVPSKGLNNVTEFIESISDVEYQNMSTENVTDSYYDIQSRLDHEKLQEKQLADLMEQAESIEETLVVREELSKVQETIEVYEGKLRLWDNLVNYSTIDIAISETPTIVIEEEDPNEGLIKIISASETFKGIARAFRNSWAFVSNFFSWLFRIIAALLLPAAIITPIVIVLVKISKKSKARQQQRFEQRMNTNQQQNPNNK